MTSYQAAPPRDINMHYAANEDLTQQQMRDHIGKTSLISGSVPPQSAVNRLVIGSNPTAGAIFPRFKPAVPRPRDYEPDELPGCSTPRLGAAIISIFSAKARRETDDRVRRVK